VSIDRVGVVKAFAQTRMAHAFLRTREDIERHQTKLWRRLAPTLARTPALAAHAGAPFTDLPVVEPSVMRAGLGDWNSLGLSASEIMAGAEAAESGGAGELRPGVFAGYSTGSSGVRGAFLSSAEERARYLGQSLAKLLPPPLLRRRRIGLCLRADNALYRDVANAGPFQFRFWSVGTPSAERAKQIEAHAPDILIAPSHVLAELARFAEAGTFKPPMFERLYYGAEPMGDAERAWIAAALGARPDPIYQATEGFLGAACQHGTLHLNEDSIAFELEPIAASDRYRLIVTDLRRTSQPMVRVRLDDLVQALDEPCRCGSALRAVAPIEGRISDIWLWQDAFVFPKQVEDELGKAVPPSADWRAVASAESVSLACEPEHADRAKSALTALLADAGVARPVTATALTPQTSPKRRRVQWIDG